MAYSGLATDELSVATLASIYFDRLYHKKSCLSLKYNVAIQPIKPTVPNDAANPTLDCAFLSYNMN